MVTGVKYDQIKLRWTLLPLKATEQVVSVLEYGAKKYKPNNWKHVKPKKRYIDACFRHLVAYAGGEKIDQESGHNHLAHAICCLLFLLARERR